MIKNTAQIGWDYTYLFGIICVILLCTLMSFIINDTRMNKNYITSTYGSEKLIVNLKFIRFIHIKESPQTSSIVYDDGTTINVDKATAEKVAESINL